MGVPRGQANGWQAPSVPVYAVPGTPPPPFAQSPHGRELIRLRARVRAPLTPGHPCTQPASVPGNCLPGRPRHVSCSPNMTVSLSPSIHRHAIAQDTPGAKFTYKATVHVPSGLRALMSALADPAASGGNSADGATTTFAFHQPVPIPVRRASRGPRPMCGVSAELRARMHTRGHSRICSPWQLAICTRARSGRAVPSGANASR